MAGHKLKDIAQFDTAQATARSISAICLGHAFDQQVARSRSSTYLRNILSCSASTKTCLNNCAADIAGAMSH